MFWNKKTKSQTLKAKVCCGSTPELTTVPKSSCGTSTVQAASCCAVVPSKTKRPEVTEEVVARRAFEIWQHEGQPCGKEMDHWFLAQKELHSADC